MAKSNEIPKVVAVSKSHTHSFSKTNAESISLLAGLGVEGDAHFGKTVKHRSRVRADPSQPNLRQVHLIHYELIIALRQQGFHVDPGVMGENITTIGIDLLGLPGGTLLHLGSSAHIEVTGLRNPCKQLDEFQSGLLNSVLDRTQSGELILKAGIMGVVVESGIVKPDDQITAVWPSEPHEKLKRV